VDGKGAPLGLWRLGDALIFPGVDEAGHLSGIYGMECDDIYARSLLDLVRVCDGFRFVHEKQSLRKLQYDFRFCL